MSCSRRLQSSKRLFAQVMVEISATTREDDCDFATRCGDFLEKNVVVVE